MDLQLYMYKYLLNKKNTEFWNFKSKQSDRSLCKVMQVDSVHNYI